MKEKIKNIIGYLAVLFCICYFLFEATSDESGDPSLAAGIVISIGIILLIDYMYEFLKTPENRDYTAVVLVIGFFLGTGIGSLFGSTYSALWGGMIGVFLCSGIITIFKSPLEKTFPGLYRKPPSKSPEEEDWEENEENMENW